MIYNVTEDEMEALRRYVADWSKNSTLVPIKDKETGKKIGATASVKAAIRYNDLLRFWKLNTKHSYIAQGDKVKWVWLKPNPYQLDALAYLEFDLPEKVHTFIEKYVDRKKIFDSILLNKLEGFYTDLGWILNLNPYKQKLFNL